MAGKIKPLKKKEQKKEEPKEEKKEEPPKEELESKLEDKEAEEIAAREQPTLPDLEDTVEAAAEAENIPPPPEEQLHYQTAQPQQQGEGYQARPGPHLRIHRLLGLASVWVVLWIGWLAEFADEKFSADRRKSNQSNAHNNIQD